jgi:hypothetical protein
MRRVTDHRSRSILVRDVTQASEEVALREKNQTYRDVSEEAAEEAKAASDDTTALDDPRRDPEYRSAIVLSIRSLVS